MSVRVALADDQALVRAGLRALLKAQQVEVVFEADDGADLLAKLETQPVDVVLSDIRMPGVDGIEATRRITADERLSGTRVLILTMFDLDEYLFAALRAGASGFLLKDTPPDELIDAVRLIAAGESLLGPSATRRIMEEFARLPAAAASGSPVRLEGLTPREHEVLVAVARGRCNAEIAETLFMSHATVKTHVSRLLTKLHARDRTQLVMLAYEAGVVRPGVAE